MGKKSGSGTGIRYEPPGSYFLELRNNFFELRNHFFSVKILKFFDADPGSGMESNSDPGSWTEKSRIRDREKQPGSATLLFCQEHSRLSVPLIVVTIFEE
jgi:hypothetical protein